MKFSGSSGVRMEWGKELFDFANEIGLKIGGNYKRVIIGGDFRTTTKTIIHTLAGAISAAGCNVDIAGHLPTPSLAYAAQKYDLGVMVTASHNPSEYNGIKLWNPDGSALKELKFVGNNVAKWDRIGKVDEFDAVSYHFNALVRVFQNMNLKVVIDCANGAASVLSPYVFKALEAKVITLNCHPSGLFSGHPSEPTEQNLKYLKKMVIKTGSDIGVAHDGDSDRFIAITSSGRYVDGDHILAVFTKILGFEKIVAPVDSSMLLDSLAKVVRVKVGDANVSMAMKEQNIEFGGENSGTQIFGDWRYTPDAIYASLKFAEIASKHDIDEVIDSFPTYYTMRKSIIYNDRKDMERKVKKLVSEYDNVTSIDGFRVGIEKGWFLIRFSGTEPKIRVTVEHEDMKKAEALIDEIIRTLST